MSYSMPIKRISSIKLFRFSLWLAGGMVASCLLMACGNQAQVDAYEVMQQPPGLQATSSIDTQPSKNDALLKKGLGEQIRLNDKPQGSVLLLALDKDTALQVLESALEYHHIEIVDQNREQGYEVIQLKSEEASSAGADSANEHYGPDGIYTSGEGLLDNVSSLWSTKTETVGPGVIRYKLSAKQREDGTAISAYQLPVGASYKGANVEHQKQLFLMLYKSLRDGFATK